MGATTALVALAGKLARGLTTYSRAVCSRHHPRQSVPNPPIITGLAYRSRKRWVRLSFYEGSDLAAELRRLETLVWEPD